MKGFGSGEILDLCYLLGKSGRVVVKRRTRMGMDGRCVEGYYVRIDTQMIKFEVVNRG